MNGEPDALVVGGGLAGSMVALELAAAGRRVVLLEKSKGPHDKVCGEFLSRESLHYLERHSIDVAALGGVPIESVRIVTNSFTRQQDLPFAAMSLTRRTLDEELLRCVSAAGASVLRDASVDSLEVESGTWSVRLRNGPEFRASDVFLATGKHDLRGWPRPGGRHRGLIGFKTYYRLTATQMAELGNTVELILFPGGYAGLQPVEDSVVNLCLLIEEEKLRKEASGGAAVMMYLLRHSPHLVRRFTEAMPCGTAPLTVSRVPYGHVQRETQDGLWRVGDQAAVIPSFCGDGMSIALHSGALAAARYLQGGSARVYQRMLHDQLARRIWLATCLSKVLVERPQAAQVVRLLPALLPGIALMTRIPEDALLTTALS